MSAPRADEWLSRVLERAVFSVDGDTEISPEPTPALYYAKVPVDDVAQVARLCARGFAPVDVNVTLAHGGQVPPPSGDVAVDVAPPSQHERLVEIAGSCFRYSRFHLDPGLPGGLADEIKREWVRSYVHGRRGVELLSASQDGHVVGFLAVLESGDARVIDLVGVDPAAQGQGVGSALVSAFVARHAQHAAELRVGTQIANVPSLRLYEKHGFRVVAASYVLHRHA